MIETGSRHHPQLSNLKAHPEWLNSLQQGSVSSMFYKPSKAELASESQVSNM